VLKISESSHMLSVVGLWFRGRRVEGLHKVVVKKTAYEEKKTKYDSPQERSVALMPKELLPRKYANSTTTPIEVTVSTAGPNEATIEVKSR
jgi:hypothetical protein